MPVPFLFLLPGAVGKAGSADDGRAVVSSEPPPLAAPDDFSGPGGDYRLPRRKSTTRMVSSRILKSSVGEAFRT
jgi:hypothetical protein